MAKVFIIAEAACTWLHAGLEGAYRSIRAAKECGADAWKTQWTSDPALMSARRGIDNSLHYLRLYWDRGWHAKLKAKCDEVGVEYMCTAFTPRCIEFIEPYIKRFKVSAYERKDFELIHAAHEYGKRVIVSYNGDAEPNWRTERLDVLYCVSEYPTPLERLGLGHLYHRGPNCEDIYDGLSDHTTSTLTGALCVAAGGRIVEKHVKLDDTPDIDPDFPHSLTFDKFKVYCELIREAERAM